MDVSTPWIMNKSYKSLQQGGQFAKAVLVVLLSMLIVPDAAWALQSHGPPEGIYVHQMAHAFFVGSLVFLFLDLRRSVTKSQGWISLKKFCLLMIVWNVVAFTGHAVATLLAPRHIAGAESFFHAQLLGPMDLTKLTFYITRFDHLLLVPSLFFLFVGLRTLYLNVEREVSQGGGQ